MQQLSIILKSISPNIYNVATIVFMMLTSGTSIAQLNDTLKNIDKDEYIEHMDNYLGFKASMSNSKETFKVTTPLTTIDIFPNTKTRIGLDFNYRFISAGFKIAPDFLPGNGNEKEKGKTKDCAIGLQFIFKHLFQSVNYSSVRGFYLYNTKDYHPGWEKGDAYIQFPDLKYTGFEGSTGYSFNSHFSLKALTTQTDRQLKSAGSFIPLSKYRYYIINDKSQASPSHSTQRSDNIEINLGIGYYYVLVIKKNFYISLGATPSIGYLHLHLQTDYYTEKIYSNQNNVIFRWDSRAAIGYNGRKFFIGGYMNAAGASYNQENTTIVTNDTQVSYQVFIGYRINPFKIVKNQTDFMEQQIKTHTPQIPHKQKR